MSKYFEEVPKEDYSDQNNNLDVYDDEMFEDIIQETDDYKNQYLEDFTIDRFRKNAIDTIIEIIVNTKKYIITYWVSLFISLILLSFWYNTIYDIINAYTLTVPLILNALIFYCLYYFWWYDDYNYDWYKYEDFKDNKYFQYTYEDYLSDKKSIIKKEIIFVIVVIFYLTLVYNWYNYMSIIAINLTLYVLWMIWLYIACFTIFILIMVYDNQKYGYFYGIESYFKNDIRNSYSYYSSIECKKINTIKKELNTYVKDEVLKWKSYRVIFEEIKNQNICDKIINEKINNK